MTAPVLRELREVLKETRQPLGRTAVAGFDEVSSNYPAGGENSVRRFEKEETSPAYENIDAMVGAYAEATGTSVFDLWDEAIDRARKAVRAPKKNEAKPPPPLKKPSETPDQRRRREGREAAQRIKKPSQRRREAS
jgi:hypothetical protein